MGAAAEVQAARFDRPRQGLYGFLTLPHQTQAAHVCGVFFSRQSGRAGKRAVQFGPGGDAGLAQCVDQPLAQRAGGFDADLLTQNGPHGQLKTIQAAGQTLAQGLRKIKPNDLCDAGGLGVQVQPVPHLRHHLGQNGVQ